MTGFKQGFVVKSRGKKENEKEDEIKRTYHVFLMDNKDAGMRINLHSDKPIPLSLGDELELKSVKFQKLLGK